MERSAEKFFERRPLTVVRVDHILILICDAELLLVEIDDTPKDLQIPLNFFGK